MALPYPEGQVYFRRTALKLLDAGYNFDAENDKSFYSHCLLENVWNTWAFSSNTNPDINHVPYHPRATAKKGFADSYGTYFGVWDKTTIMYSDERGGSNYTSKVELENNQNYNELRNRDQGGPLKTILRPFPLANAKYMCIDWVNPFRAIYFPLAHQAGPGYEDLCIYLMVDFRLRQGVQMWSPMSSVFLNLPFDREKGLTYQHTDVMCFDLKGLYNYLTLPREMRNPKKGLYKTEKLGDELITMWGQSKQSVSPHGCKTLAQLQFYRGIDLVSVINDNFGVDVCWQPYEYSSWALNFVLHIIELGIGFIPVVGPLLSVSFSVGMQAITDPDSFTLENILNLPLDVLAAVASGGMEMRGNLPEGHQKARAMILYKRTPKDPEEEQK